MVLIAHRIGRAAWADSFHYRDYRLLWGASLISFMGLAMEMVGLGWVVLKLTDSPFMVGVSSAAHMAPFFFLGILSGAVADRVNRRLFIRFVLLGGSIVAGLMALILLSHVDQVWYVIGLAAAGGCIAAFLATVSQAYTFDIVGPKSVLNGLALISISHSMGGVVGALVAGVIIAVMGAGGLYVVVSATYLASAAVLLATRHEGQAALTHREPVLQNLRGYVRLIRQNRTLLILMFLAATTEIFGFTHGTLLPVLARDVLGVGSVGLGFMSAVRWGGGMLGPMILAAMGPSKRKGRLMFMFSTAFGLGLMAFNLSTNLFLFLGLLIFVNACANAADTLYRTLMQSNVANEERGRAMGSWVLSIGTAPVGHVGIGGIAGAIGAQGALLTFGSALTFVSLTTAIGLPRMRRLP